MGECEDKKERRKRQAPNHNPPHPGQGPGDGPGPRDGPPAMQQPADVALEWKFLQKFMSLNETLRQIIGHQFTDFVKECTFRGETCLNET